MTRNVTFLLIFVALTSVTCQTFQYSRGWTNGKRAGHKPQGDDVKEISTKLQRIFSPCQMNKLKYVLEGKPWSERLLSICEVEEDNQMRYKNDHITELYDVFQ